MDCICEGREVSCICILFLKHLCTGGLFGGYYHTPVEIFTHPKKVSRYRMAYYRKKTNQKEDFDIEIKSLTASSDSQLMWPLVKYHMCNVLHDADTIWNSGRYAPASIRIKLTDGPQRVTSVKLQAEMSPLKAMVHHEISVGSTIDNMHVVGCIKRFVSHGAWFHLAVNDDNVQFIEIKTIASPSYVAWKRIKVYGRG